jgi:putative RecB family exonuclease
MSWDDVWNETFLEAIGETEKRFDSNPVNWRAAGRASKANPDKEGKNWWDQNGKEMFFNFITAWQNSKFELWVTPEGVPAAELYWYLNFGDVPIKAYADAIVVEPSGELAVIDFKTGAFMPSSSMQLGLYACCMEMQFGIRPSKGYFYDARKAEFRECYDLDRWTIPLMVELFAQFVRGIDANIYLPNLGMACMTCGVKDYCYAAGGQLAQIYDPLAEIK